MDGIVRVGSSALGAPGLAEGGKGGMAFREALVRPQGEALGPAKGAPGPLDGMVHDLARCQGRIDQAIAQARAGRTFSPKEIVDLQMDVYRADMAIQISAKVVDHLVGGVRQVMGIQV